MSVSGNYRQSGTIHKAPTLGLFDLLAASRTGTKNLATLTTAITAGTVKVVGIGHSVLEGSQVTQNWPDCSPFELFARLFRQAFPSVAASFVNLGLGGRTADNYGTAAHIIDTTGYVGAANDNSPATSFFRSAQGGTYQSYSWISPTGSPTNGSTLNKSWRNHVLAESPDLVIVQFDLNDLVLSTYVTAMKFILDDFKNHIDWTAKRPSVILVASHTGNQRVSLMHQFAQTLRGLARVYGVPLIDAGRVYEILITGADPAGPKRPNGEMFFKYPGNTGLSSSFLLDTSYWANVVGTGYSAAGTQIRDQSSGVLVALRKRSASDVTIAGKYSSFNASSVPSLFYRADPADLTNTASRYEVKISGITCTLLYQATGGGQTVLGTATVAAISGSSNHTVKVTVSDSAHRVWVNGVLVISVDDFSSFLEGYAGIGISGAGGAWNIGSTFSNAFFIEYYDPFTVTANTFAESDLLGQANDFFTNLESAGGNTINHMTSDGYLMTYTPAIAAVIAQIQSVA